MVARSSRPPFRSGRVCVATLVLFALAAPSGVRAAETGTASSLADTTKPAALLKEFVVTDSRYAREIYRSPQSLSLVSLRNLRQ